MINKPSVFLTIPFQLTIITQSFLRPIPRLIVVKESVKPELTSSLHWLAALKNRQVRNTGLRENIYKKYTKISASTTHTSNGSFQSNSLLVNTFCLVNWSSGIEAHQNDSIIFQRHVIQVRILHSKNVRNRLRLGKKCDNLLFFDV